MSGFKERFKEAVGTMSAREVGRRAGISDAMIRSYISGESSPGLDKLPALAQATEVRAAWLATGEPPMRGERVENYSAAAKEASGQVTEERGTFLVPRLDVEASAGYGTLDQQEMVVEHVAFKPDFLRDELGVNVNTLVLIRARGDSMEPTIRDGDLLLIDHSQIVSRTDGIYLVSVEGRLMVKRLQFLLDGQLEIISDNKNYRPLLVDDRHGDQVQLVGRVVWTGRRT